MFTIKVNEKEYRIKFGYLALSKSGILSEVMKIQNIVSEKEKKDKAIEEEKKNRETFPEYYDSDDAIEENDTEDNIIFLQNIMAVLPKLILAGLQKNHKEFAADYDLEDDVKRKEYEVIELLDDYMDEEDSLDMIDLYSGLVEELFNNGFLARKSQKLEKAMTETDATTTPTDHKAPKN